MAGPFHRGELAVQERAGVRERAARIGNGIHATLPEPAREFLLERRFVVLATADRGGRPWASLLAGPPGFARAVDPGTVRVEADPLPGDPLADHLAETTFAGLLAIDLATRRRMRVNGRLTHEPGALLLRADQVYSNCPKYIRPREAPWEPGGAGLLARAGGLSDAQRAWIRGADTFFLATANPGEGADASHRGGEPGFLQVDDDRLVWPDYAGNMMYNSLGNIAVHPRAGLLVPDFARGALLQLTGRARIVWDPERIAAVPGAQRLVELDVEAVVEVGGLARSGPP